MDQVAPAELEHIILQHPEVEDAAVIGIPDEIAGHVPRAFVVKREGSCLTMTGVADFLHGDYNIGLMHMIYFKLVDEIFRAGFSLQIPERRSHLLESHSKIGEWKNSTKRASSSLFDPC